MPQQGGGLTVEGLGLQPGGEGRRLPLGGPLPQLVETHLLEPLGPQECLTLPVEHGGGGDPAGHPPGALDRFAHQRFHHVAVGWREGSPGLGQGEVIHLPAGAAPVQPSGHDQPQGLGGMGGGADQGYVDDRRLRQGRHHGTEETLRQSQQESPLKLGKEGKKGRVLEQMELPPLQPLDPPSAWRGTLQPIHPQTNPLDVFRVNGHGQGWGPVKGLRVRG